MRGIGEASAAITFVNALPTGTGAAAAISLASRAFASVEPAPAGQPSDVRAPDRPGTPLIDACARAALARLGSDRSWSIDIRVDSEIPVGRGLKSSSSVGGATVLAVADALGQAISREAAARIAARASIDIGLSATGAFDDACAALLGGCVVTDNTTLRILRRCPIPAELGVVLWIPPQEHAPSRGWHERFRERADEAQAAADAALAGDLFEAMRRNTSLVEELLGYEYTDLHRRGAELGAIASGVSGLGPTVAFVAPAPRLRALREGLPHDGVEIRVEGFRPEHHAGEGAA